MFQNKGYSLIIKSQSLYPGDGIVGMKTLKYVILENNWEYRRYCRLFIRTFVSQNNRIYSESPLRLFYPYSLRILHFSKSTSLSSSFIPKRNLYFYCKFYGAIFMICESFWCKECFDWYLCFIRKISLIHF